MGVWRSRRWSIRWIGVGVLLLLTVLLVNNRPHPSSLQSESLDSAATSYVKCNSSWVAGSMSREDATGGRVDLVVAEARATISEQGTVIFTLAVMLSDQYTQQGSLSASVFSVSTSPSRSLPTTPLPSVCCSTTRACTPLLALTFNLCTSDCRCTGVFHPEHASISPAGLSWLNRGVCQWSGGSESNTAPVSAVESHDG